MALSVKDLEKSVNLYIFFETFRNYLSNQKVTHPMASLGEDKEFILLILENPLRYIRRFIWLYKVIPFYALIKVF